MNAQLDNSKKYFRKDHFSWNRFSAKTIGDWEGEEQVAAYKLNRILDLFNLVLPAYVQPTIINTLYYKTWDNWAINTQILDASDDSLTDYVCETLKLNLHQNNMKQAA